MIALTFKIFLTCLVGTFCLIPLDEYRGRYRVWAQRVIATMVLLDMLLLLALVLMGIWL